MPRVKGTTRSRRSTAETRERLCTSTTHLLATSGYAATTTRAIGEQAGCDAALVAYHFGSLNALLLAALDASNDARMAAYEKAVATAANRRALVVVLRELYAEDRRCGHTALLAQLVAGGLMDRELGREVARRMGPWVTFAEATMRAHLPAAVRRRAPARELAYALVAGFLGLEVLDDLLGERAEGTAVLNALTSASGWRRGRAGGTPGADETGTDAASGEPSAADLPHGGA